MEKLKFKRPKEPVLIVDDNKAMTAVLSKYCQLLDIEYEIAFNGKEGLSLVKKTNFSIFIVDLMMPVMDGKTFIKEIKSVLPDAVIIVQTSNNDPKTIIEIMKLNVFDYMLKPIDSEVFKQVILKSLEHKALLDFKNLHQLYAEKKVQSQIDWLLYKETLLVKDQVKQNTSPILNLHTSLNSGAGIGTLVTILDLVKATVEKKDNKYTVDAEYLDILFENGEYCKKQIHSLSEFSNVLNTKFELRASTSLQLLDRIYKLKNDSQELFAQKKIECILPEEVKKCNIAINENTILLAIHEIFVNAYKYSPPDSKIFLLTNIKDGYFWLSIKNSVDLSSGFGIPAEYEHLVTEPFFRLVQVVDESVVGFEKFSIGLGLTAVDFILKKHNGLFFIHEMMDHTQRTSSKSVFAEILLPYTL
ncbi:MAG: response regulator [Leptospiraceae bacterium]|nr:response regulator [Leptospiraceae bacterium]MCP5497593.1 response regulator [Leptospiraceae bacterium]